MLSLVLILAVSSLAEAGNTFRFGYDEPQGQVAQFYSGNDDAYIYNWAYQYPGQSHYESKDQEGIVTGSYIFTDANGEIQHADYISHPETGFVVQQSTKGVGPVVGVPSVVYPDPALSSPSEVVVDEAPYVPTDEVVDVVPVEYSQVDYQNLAKKTIPLDSGSERVISQASPAVLNAVRTGQLVPVLGYDNQIVFRVGDELVDTAQGSVSFLADVLDVDTVAPRHDQKTPVKPVPTFYTQARNANIDIEPQTRGFIDYETFTDGSKLVVRIPY